MGTIGFVSLPGSVKLFDIGGLSFQGLMIYMYWVPLHF